MRNGLLALLLGMSGCLYVGGINHAPAGEIEVETLEPKQGDWVTLRAGVTDPDGDDIRYEWEVAVTPIHGKPYTRKLSDEQSTDDGFLVPIGEGLSRVKLHVVDRGTHGVLLHARDGQGAYRDLTASFEVANQAPTIAVLLDIEPEYKLTDRYPDTGFADTKVRNPAHAHYLLRLREEDTVDYEDDLRCGNDGTIKYEVLQPDQSLVNGQVVACKKGELIDRYRFRLDPTKVTAPVTAKIKVTVDDGNGATAEQIVSVDLVPNRPACIKGMDGTSPKPDHTVPVTHEEGMRFEVTWPDDDVDEGYHYSWLVRDAGAASFEPVQQASGAVFDMPAWYRMPGDDMELRVVIADKVMNDAKGQPGCSEDTVLCQDPAADLPAECYQWVTWHVEFW